MSILGLHHITIVSADAQRTVDFYTGVLGLRLVKQTVNFDDPGSYHLYFGDQHGSAGTIITFFEWPRAPRGATGIGGTHHLALSVANEQALLKWKRRLLDAKVRVNGPYDRNYFKSLYFRDPDGTIIEIATKGPGWTVDEPLESLGQTALMPPMDLMSSNRNECDIATINWPEPVPEITADMSLHEGLHHISAIGASVERSHEFYAGILGLQRVKMTYNFDDPTSAHWYWGSENGKPGTVMTYFERDPAHTRPVRMGAGQTHHIAFAVANDDEQLAWRERLLSFGKRVSPVQDRTYFKSIYTNDPDGHIIELATLGPGFAVDEPVEQLGKSLKLPPWLETQRSLIEEHLTPLVIPCSKLAVVEQSHAF
ncbi:MAG: VOC family protein [Chloroflexi bacterium]|nr:VOC family protein [Chloroflexota bacterium]